VRLLVVRQLEGLAAAGRRVVLLVDALDEAQDRGNNPVVRLLQKLGKAKTQAVNTIRSNAVCFHPTYGVNLRWYLFWNLRQLSLVVTMRPEPEANLQILRR